MRRLQSLLIAALAMLCCASAQADFVYSLNPLTDTTARDNGLDGSFDSVSGETSGGLAAQLNNGSVLEDRGGMIYGLGGIPASQEITQASLHLHVSFAFDSPDSNLVVYGYSDTDGVLTGADFLLGSPLATFAGPSITGGTIINLDVTSFIAGLHNTAASFAGFIFRTTTPGGLVILSPRETTIPGQAPELTITAVPLPASAVLLGMGLMSCLGTRRLRRQRTATTAL